ncbi:DUF1579 domain-containing protein [Stella sp.]|jgi:hypothetical protein|uniref:DUF1579 domain-containing protein n=1 Tax=Stella sp. TaxID=2912054 RepID=UPI0035B0624E
MKLELLEQHRWLERLAGEWSVEGECSTGPDQPPVTTEMRESARMMGGAWLLAEGSGEMPGGGAMASLMQLGYDPAKGKFVGTFAASMMSHLWTYEGSLDPSGKILTLDTVGPSFADPAAATPGAMTKYQDIIEIVDADHRVMRSRMLGPDGEWRPVMTARYRRRL